MTDAPRPLPAGTPPSPAAARIEAALVSWPTAILVGLALYALFPVPAIHGLWASRDFGDSDDAMRMLQVREWMAGKGWGDLVETRMNPPDGVRMHWTRVVDLPIAGLIRLFSAVLSRVDAEMATRLVLPALIFTATLVLLVALARRLDGPGAGLAVGILAPLTAFVAQARLGRVDHHDAQIALLVAATFALVVSLDPARARAGIATAIAAALSLAISIENLPFLVAISAAYALAAAASPAQGRAAAIYGASLAAACAVAWGLFADPAAGPVCDAFSTVQLTLAIVGGLGLAALGSLAPRLGTAARWIGLAALGAAMAGLLVGVFPQCLADPLAGVPRLVVDYWLADVPEALSLRRLVAEDPAAAGATVAPILVALFVALLAAWRETGVGRVRWLALAGVVAVGLAATVWQVRAATSTSAPALAAAGWALAALGRRLARFEAPRWRLALLPAALPFLSLFWVIVLPTGPAPTAGDAAGLACLRTAELVALDRAAPPGLALTTIDTGGHVLGLTGHAVLAAPYHRNGIGNADALAAWLSPPDEAHAVMTRRGVTHVAFCPGQADFERYANRVPTGLAAHLRAGDVLPWLEPLPVAGHWRLLKLR